MKAPIARAISDKRRIPTLIPDIVDEVAIAVIIQMIITYNKKMTIEIMNENTQKFYNPITKTKSIIVGYIEK